MIVAPEHLFQTVRNSRQNSQTSNGCCADPTTSVNTAKTNSRPPRRGRLLRADAFKRVDGSGGLRKCAEPVGSRVEQRPKDCRIILGSDETELTRCIRPDGKRLLIDLRADAPDIAATLHGEPELDLGMTEEGVLRSQRVEAFHVKGRDVMRIVGMKAFGQTYEPVEHGATNDRDNLDFRHPTVP